MAGGRTGCQRLQVDPLGDCAAVPAFAVVVGSVTVVVTATLRPLLTPLGGSVETRPDRR